jgi:hypothetical protein
MGALKGIVSEFDLRERVNASNSESTRGWIMPNIQMYSCVRADDPMQVSVHALSTPRTSKLQAQAFGDPAALCPRSACSARRSVTAAASGRPSAHAVAIVPPLPPSLKSASREATHTRGAEREGRGKVEGLETLSTQHVLRKTCSKPSPLSRKLVCAKKVVGFLPNQPIE